MHSTVRDSLKRRTNLYKSPSIKIAQQRNTALVFNGE